MSVVQHTEITYKEESSGRLKRPMKGIAGTVINLSALSRANVGVAVESTTDIARGAADIFLTDLGLSTIVHAIRQSRIIFHCISIVVAFVVLAWAFTYKFDFLPFMVLIIALLNDGTSFILLLLREWFPL